MSARYCVCDAKVNPFWGWVVCDLRSVTRLKLIFKCGQPPPPPHPRVWENILRVENSRPKGAVFMSGLSADHLMHVTTLREPAESFSCKVLCFVMMLVCTLTWTQRSCSKESKPPNHRQPKGSDTKEKKKKRNIHCFTGTRELHVYIYNIYHFTPDTRCRLKDQN